VTLTHIIKQARLMAAWRSIVVARVPFLRRQTEIRMLLFLICLTVFVITSSLASSYRVEIPSGLYMPVVRHYCPSALRLLALNLGGAVLPLIMGILLAVAFLRSRWSMFALALITLTAGFAAYQLSGVRAQEGIELEWPWIALVSGGLASLVTIPIMIKIAWGTVEPQIRVRALIQKMVEPNPALYVKGIALGYFAGVVGSLIGADILHTCSLGPALYEIEIGGEGIFDGISLSGLAGAWLAVVSTTGIWFLIWLIAWLVARFKGKSVTARVNP